MSLGNLQPIIDQAMRVVRDIDEVSIARAAVAVLPTLAGVGMTRGTYTPAGGTGSLVSGSVRIDESPHGGTQRRHAQVRFLLLEVTVDPTDGATFLADGITWTIRTARRESASIVCEAWA